MKSAALISVSLLVGAKSAKVLCSSRHDVGSQHHDDPAQFLLSYAYVKVNLWILLRLLRLRNVAPRLRVIVALQRFACVLLQPSVVGPYRFR